MKFTTIKERGKRLLATGQTITEEEGKDYYGEELFEKLVMCDYFKKLDVKIKRR